MSDAPPLEEAPDTPLAGMGGGGGESSKDGRGGGGGGARPEAVAEATEGFDDVWPDCTSRRAS